MGGIDLSSLANQRIPILGHLFGLFELLIGWLLAAIYSVVPSYGFAIILLTIIVRLLLMPITAKSTKSMAAMQKLQPEIKRLQAKYRSDRQKLNEELMALYKANNVNPAMGCLPLLAQMPVMIALYRVFYIPRSASGQLPISHLPPNSQLVTDICGGVGRAGYHAPNGDEPDKFVFMCDPQYGQNPQVSQFLGLNLTVSPSEALKQGVVHFLPYALIMAAIIGTAYYSQAQMTKRNKNSGQAQPQAMQTVTKIMPLFFGFISFTLPTAVNLYFLTTNIFQIGQQWFMFRKQDEAGSEIVVPGPKGGSEAGSRAAKGAKDGVRASKPVGKTAPKPTGKGGAQARPNGSKKAPQKVPPKVKRDGGGNSGKRGATPKKPPDK